MDEDDESWMRPDEAEIHEAAAPKTLVDKILGVREHRNRRLEVQRSRRSVYEDVDGEFGGLEFLVKWNERALMHTEWVPSAMIEADGTQSMLKMRRFLRARHDRGLVLLADPAQLVNGSRWHALTKANTWALDEQTETKRPQHGLMRERLMDARIHIHTVPATAQTGAAPAQWS